MRDPQFLARRRNGAAAGPWEGRREQDEGERHASGWWVLEGQSPRNGVDAAKSKKELYQEAKQAGIDGRSSMNKEQLVEALHKHHSTTSSKLPTPRPPRTRHVAKGARRSPAREAERCVIAYRPTGAHGEFHVIVTEPDGSQMSAARSPAFRAQSGEIRRTGAARAAHELLVQRLVVAGWWPADSGDAWPQVQFARVRPTAGGGARCLVTVVREAGRAQFVVEELDSYGNPTPLVASDPFRAPRLLPVRPSRHAKAALRQLLDLLEPDGWTVAEHIGDEWYSISLWQHRGDG